ncbi:MAG: hypothetical protein ABJO01_13205 [Parasphingorhabdus sp.]|uniref:hypothetical protein n=1 Tax=Parasphingorhabdus sp. TaxID=2709688 RepID=UPI00329A7356
MGIKYLCCAMLMVGALAVAGQAALSAPMDNAEGKGGRVAVASLKDYPDIGSASGMQWIFNSASDPPVLAFEVPRTDNQLWAMVCERADHGRVIVAHLIVASPEYKGEGDYVQLTIRVDDRLALKRAAPMRSVMLEGERYFMPQFHLPIDHPLFSALAAGRRAYMDMDDSKFSIGLAGSGKALKGFLKACR